MLFCKKHRRLTIACKLCDADFVQRFEAVHGTSVENIAAQMRAVRITYDIWNRSKGDFDLINVAPVVVESSSELTVTDQSGHGFIALTNDYASGIHWAIRAVLERNDCVVQWCSRNSIRVQPKQLCQF